MTETTAATSVRQNAAELPFTIFRSADLLTKTYWLDEDGTLGSRVAAKLHEGAARGARATDLRDFSRQLDTLTPYEATTYGLAERDAQVVTQSQLAASPGAIARDAAHLKFPSAPGIMFLDSDAGLGIDELPALLCAAIPQLRFAPMVWRQSASAGIVRESDGVLLTDLGKWHGYIAVADVSRVVEAGKAMQDLLWGIGSVEDWGEPGGSGSQRDVPLAWMHVNAAGQALPRTLLDAAVHQPERLDFAARAPLPDGLTRLDAGSILFNDTAPLLDLDSIRVTPVQHARADANRAAAKLAVRDECEAARAAWLARHLPRVAAARGLSSDQARSVLERAIDADELPGDYMLLTQRGEWMSVHDVWGNRAAYPDGTRFADPIEPDYDEGRRVAWLYTAGGRPVIYSHAHGSQTRYALSPDLARVGFGRSADAQGAVPLPVPAEARPPDLNAAQLAHMEPLPASEDGLALTFAAQAATSFRWTPGPGWMVNTGHVWERDDHLRRFDAARRMCRAAAADAGPSSEKRRLSSAKTVSAVLTLAQSDHRITVPGDQWDRDPLALNTPAGVVDLRDGSLRPRGGELHTLCAAVAPDMTARSPTFERFMDAVFCGDQLLVEFVQRALGYCLSGDRREQVLFFWHGSGANGKSTLLDLLQWLLGTYSLKLGGAVLMTSRSERHPTEIAQLRGRRLACSSELEEGAYFNEPLLKELTGDSTASARFMRGDFFEFTQTQKHIVVGNFRPRLRGGDPAMARRIVLVPFVARFEGAARDPLMLAKLKAEGPAILAWMIRGAIAWQSDGLGIPQSVVAASCDYMALHDDLALWRDERCTPDGETKASDLFADFKRWKEGRGEHAPAATTWFQRLEVQGGVAKRRSNGIRYAGIALRSAFGAHA